MKLFFDTNVILDHALMRPTGQPLETSYLLFWAQKNQNSVYISPCCIYSITYILHKQGIRGEELKMKLSGYLSILNLCSTDKKLFFDGLNTDFKDLEDSFQFMHSIKEECDYLITSNIVDFKPYTSRKIKVLSPSQFVVQILGKRPGIDF